MGILLVEVAIYRLAAAFAAPIAIGVSALIPGKSTRPVIGGWTACEASLPASIVSASYLPL